MKDPTKIFQLQARVPSWATMLSCDAVPKNAMYGCHSKRGSWG